MYSSHPLAKITLKPGRERSALNRHPWIFSGGIDHVEGDPQPGALAQVRDSRGNVLGSGWFNPHSDIRVRMWSFPSQDGANLPWQELLKKRLDAAIALRSAWFDPARTNAFRLLNAEGDFIPGLVADYYAGHLVLQPTSRWLLEQMDTVRALLHQAVGERFPLNSIRMRVEKEVQQQEGVREGTRAWSEDPDLPPVVEVMEEGLSFDVDLAAGQKTGMFLDQRENRLRVRSLSADRRVLNLFSYTGGFSLNALAGGAREVVSVDRSAPALELFRTAVTRNGMDEGRSIVAQQDVKSYLPTLQAEGRRFDVVICDPPPFARRRDHVQQATRAYKDINRRCMQCIDNGVLMTFSCSPFVDAKLFRQVVFAAAVEAGRDVQALDVLGAGKDHPVSLFHPEGAYLDGLLLHVRR